jgi:thymidylate kinase
VSRGRPVLVAVSGVDGAGKSTLVTGIEERLRANGVAAEIVWYRPGMGMGWVDRPLRLARRVVTRLLGRGGGTSSGPTMRTIAQSDSVPASRRGVVGWVWCMLVTLTFVVGVRTQVARLRRHADVVLFDRHLADALATLDVFYRGVALGVPRWVVRRLLPRAAATVYLDLPTEVAVARKPGDTIEHQAVAAQLAAYPRYVRDLPRALTIDATLPRDEVLARAWQLVEPATRVAARGTAGETPAS